MSDFSLNVNGIEGPTPPPPPKPSTVQILWECLDATNPVYRVAVVRTEPYWGILTVAFNGKVFYTKPVTISYDAIYGVDSGDFETWSQMATEVTQAHERLQGGQP